MTDERVIEGILLPPGAVDDPAYMEGWLDGQAYLLLNQATPAPSIVSGSNERAREVLAEQLVPHLAARVREGGELNDGVFIRPSAAIAAMLAYAKEAALIAGDVEGLPLAEVLADADRLGEAVDMGRLADASSIVDTLRRLAKHARRAALAASRPTDAGAGALRLPDGPPGWDEDSMCNDHGRFACADCALPAALATPKPPVDEAMRRAMKRLDAFVSWAEADDGSKSPGIVPDDIGQVLSAIRYLTGDGAGA